MLAYCMHGFILAYAILLQAPALLLGSYFQIARKQHVTPGIKACRNGYIYLLTVKYIDERAQMSS